MKLTLVLICLFASLLQANVVINELCYDPVGEDEGFEWIELYNNGTTNINLAGAKLLRAGSSWVEVFTLPSFLLRPGRYVLIGEAQITNAQITASLAFQNGGSETDGVRYQSQDGSYTDTVLYDSPNSFNLSGDEGLGVSFAQDVPQGYSLARIKDGFDSNDSGFDFYPEASPSPGLANPTRCDYALFSASVEKQGEQWELETQVHNLSPFSPDEIAFLDVYIDGEVRLNQQLLPIPAEDSLLVNLTLPVWDEFNHSIKLRLELSADPDSLNNSYSFELMQVELLPPRLNELMYNPLTGAQEWIELYQAEEPQSRSEYSLRDYGGNQVSFSLPEQGGYYVLCPDKDPFLAQFPACHPSLVIELSNWITLNNDGDSLTLLNSGGVVIDSMSYVGHSSYKGISLEYWQNASGTYTWKYSPFSGSPGAPNSAPGQPIPPTEGRVALEKDVFYPKQGERMLLIHNLKDPNNIVNLCVYDLSGRKRRVLADRQTVQASGIMLWNGTDETGKLLPRGPYILSWESQSIGGGKILRRQLDIVLAY
ncbi:MAG TPA: lamin tail domain-containing protein [Candidatus Cloacimonadota bacterium]|nr:lamin tail domain-containing protein [Candidatus Cloacimonadota bacterium]